VEEIFDIHCSKHFWP